MNSVNQTSPTNLSTLYPDLPQTVQLEHFADLLQKLFHAIDVIILVQTDHGAVSYHRYRALKPTLYTYWSNSRWRFPAMAVMLKKFRQR